MTGAGTRLVGFDMDRQRIEAAVFPQRGRVAFSARQVVEPLGAPPDELEQEVGADARPERGTLHRTEFPFGGVECLAQGTAVKIEGVAGPVVIDQENGRQVLFMDRNRFVRDDLVEHEQPFVAPGRARARRGAVPASPSPSQYLMRPKVSNPSRTIRSWWNATSHDWIWSSTCGMPRNPALTGTSSSGWECTLKPITGWSPSAFHATLRVVRKFRR